MNDMGELAAPTVAGAGYDWPRSEHGIFVNHKDNVCLAGNGAKDGMCSSSPAKGTPAAVR